MPFAPSSVLVPVRPGVLVASLFLVAMPFAPSSVLVPIFTKTAESHQLLAFFLGQRVRHFDPFVVCFHRLVTAVNFFRLVAVKRRSQVSESLGLTSIRNRQWAIFQTPGAQPTHRPVVCERSGTLISVRSALKGSGINEGRGLSILNFDIVGSLCFHRRIW